jgi:GNAT superfamily N-acetyltransferase
MPGERTARLVEDYWSRFLGVPFAALRAPGIVVTPHAGLAGWRGVWIFVRGASAVVSAPPERAAALRAAAGSWPPGSLLEPETAASLIGVGRAAVVGPSFQGWLAPERFAGPAKPARLLTAADRPALHALRAACSPADWESAGAAAGAQLFGTFEGPELVALVALRDRGAGACDPGVVTHPAHRGRGHGLAAVAAAVSDALSRGQLVLYQTLLENRPALRIAEKLGFERYATLVAVRLGEET